MQMPLKSPSGVLGLSVVSVDVRPGLGSKIVYILFSSQQSGLGRTGQDNWTMHLDNSTVPSPGLAPRAVFGHSLIGNETVQGRFIGSRHL